MGRRSINTTKSGGYMNPTDQARKEARKKELKKNKKQRQMVRAAVLKMKDPNQILDELQKIDEMEFNVLQPSPLNEKVLKEKRKKLKETFDRVLKMYDKDEPEKWVDLKRQEMEYEKRRALLISYYESVKHAQSVQVDDIPLPTLQVPDNLMFGNMPSQIPLPLEGNLSAPKPILKKDSVYKEKPQGVGPPGVPPGPPVDFSLLLMEAKLETKHKKNLRFADVNDEGPPGEPAQPMPQIDLLHIDPHHAEELDPDLDHHVPQSAAAVAAAAAAAAVAPKPTSLQQRMLALSGQNIDDFMKEMEEVHRKRERDRAADLNARLSALKHTPHTAGSDSDSDNDAHDAHAHHSNDLQLEPPGAESRQLLPEAESRPLPLPLPMNPLLPPGLRPPPMRGLAPPLRLGMPMRPAPPGPPPGLPPRAILRPPGPPPGAPPRLLRPLVPPPKVLPPVSVLTAAPQLITKKDGPQGATIIAKPQIRNLSADVTRFVPSALRVKREDKKAKPGIKTAVQRPADLPKQAPSKDDAYMQFMREMEGLL